MVWNVDPVFFSLGPITVRWYGLLFVIGFMIGFHGMKRMFRRDGYPLEVVDALLVHVMVGTIVGARLGHCFFYEPAYFFSHPLEIFAVWKGGLASHGGFLGVFIGTLRFSRRYQVPFLYVIDRVALLSLFSGALIRLGNLMNSEILGRPTDVPWAFVFERVDSIPRHPTQIYESLAYATISLTAWRLESRKHKTLPAGFLLGFILAFGFSARFLIEFFKENQEPFEKDLPLNMGQLLSLLPVLVGIGLMIWNRGRKPETPATRKKRKMM